MPFSRLRARRRRPISPGSRPGPPAHRLIRDAVEAEDMAVDWLHWVGYADVHRCSTAQALGIEGRGLVADVRFEPLPMERETLASLVAKHGQRPRLFVSFTFAGWTPEALVWAERHDIPLVRFTFAGSLHPSTESARRLRTQNQATRNSHVMRQAPGAER
jgi:hypothetical protein